jgi:hypothetical protein
MHDHRKLGRELELFDTDPLVGAGLPYWLPAGAAVRHALEEYIRELERRAGYQHVHSPVLGKRELYEISGHWAHYRADMYPPMDMGREQPNVAAWAAASATPDSCPIRRSSASGKPQRARWRSGCAAGGGFRPCTQPPRSRKSPHK